VVGGAFAAARARHCRRPRGAGLRPLLSPRHAAAYRLPFHRGECRKPAPEDGRVILSEAAQAGRRTRRPAVPQNTVESALCADSSSEAPVFKDKNLENAVRKFVFDKRDNDKPIVEADVANLSTIQGVGMEIADLSGLEKCASLASLDLSKNRIKALTPLQGLSKLQYLNLADNQIEDIAPLAEDMALQYLELSNNQVKDLKPLHGLTNL